MSSPTHQQFIEAGMQLYPQYGYRQLSVRLVAAHAGLSPGMFHHVFASKDEFVVQILQHYYAQSFAQLDMSGVSGTPHQRLRSAVWQLARLVRTHLGWIKQAIADCSAGIGVVDDFVRPRHKRLADDMVVLVQNCDDCGGDSAVLAQKMAFLNGAVFAPIVLLPHLLELRMYPTGMEVSMSAALEDEAIGLRIDWAFAALFGQLPAQEG